MPDGDRWAIQTERAFPKRFFLAYFCAAYLGYFIGFALPYLGLGIGTGAFYYGKANTIGMKLFLIFFPLTPFGLFLLIPALPLAVAFTITFHEFRWKHGLQFAAGGSVNALVLLLGITSLLSLDGDPGAWRRLIMAFASQGIVQLWAFAGAVAGYVFWYIAIRPTSGAPRSSHRQQAAR